MLTVRTSQIKVFERAARLRFEDEMVIHSKKFSVRLSELLGEQQLRIALRAAIAKAESYGFTYRGPVRLFIELMFLCGSGFDTDPQYFALGELLRAPGDQMERAERIHEGVIDYLGRVSGPSNSNVHRALCDIQKFAKNSTELSWANFEASMLHEVQSIFPEKANYIGEDGLNELIRDGVEEARKYGFPSPRGEALVVVLMFAFGHGCTDDPLYPWISRTLRDERIADPSARAKRLEKKATTWLEHVVARNGKLNL